MTREEQIEHCLKKLKLSWIREHLQATTTQAVKQHKGHLDYLHDLLAGECDCRMQRNVERKIRQARFPSVKTLDHYDWHWPEEIDRMQIEQTFSMSFLNNASNVVFIGNTGMGKTHLATALGYKACQQGKKVLYQKTVDMINHLLSAQKRYTLKEELKKYSQPDLLILDELGYLPIDKNGADLLFQVISNRYESSSTVITTNKAYKNWAEIFCKDNTVTSAVLDRVLHHCETIKITGQSYRMKKAL
jgi:DNA replication protein DnaC